MSAGPTPNSFLFSSTLFFTPVIHYFRALFFVLIARLQVEVEQNSKITVKNSKTLNNDLNVYKEISLEGMSVLEHVAVKELTDWITPLLWKILITAYQEDPLLGYPRFY